MTNSQAVESTARFMKKQALVNTQCRVGQIPASRRSKAEQIGPDFKDLLIHSGDEKGVENTTFPV